MGKRGKAAASITPLIEVEWKVPWVLLDGGDGGTQFLLELIGDFHRSLGLVLGEDFVEILLDERMERERAAHARFLERETPAQNSGSVSGVTLPDSSSASRRLASSSASTGLVAGGALRKSSTASFIRERCGSFSAKL